MRFLSSVFVSTDATAYLKNRFGNLCHKVIVSAELNASISFGLQGTSKVVMIHITDNGRVL